MLVYSVIVTPFRIAFYDIDTLGWILFDIMVDLVFFLDIILNFFTAYFDFEDTLVKDRRVIARSYLKSWFFIDVVSILPISLILQAGRDYASLARLARLPRLYRLMKMAKYKKTLFLFFYLIISLLDL
jgi:hypothetical protein